MVVHKGVSLSIIADADFMRIGLFAYLQDCCPVLTVVAMFNDAVVYRVKDNPLTLRVRICTPRFRENVVVVDEVKVDSSVTKVDSEGIVGQQVTVQVLLVSISGIGIHRRRKVLLVQVVRTAI